MSQFHTIWGESYDTEAEVLAAHDEGEELHAFRPVFGDGETFDGEVNTCIDCGDTEEGLMHNNTVRSIDPLLDLDACSNGCICKEAN